MTVEPLTGSWVAEHLPARPERGHKGTFGRVLVVAGSIDYPGAAVLTALGALRTGAGVVRVAAAESVAARLAAAIPEATWMALDEEAPGIIAPAGWRRVTSESSSYDAAVIGPGLGQHPATQRRSRQLVATIRTPTVVDADGLNALAGEARWWEARAPLVVTPHPGEFARLIGAASPTGDDDEARAAAAAGAARRWGHVVVLKGARTVIAEPDGTVLRSDVATPALATGGSGDVLAGAIGALLAAGATSLVAAACAVVAHGSAGLLAAERIGRAGTMATDIAALLPEAIERLRQPRR